MSLYHETAAILSIPASAGGNLKSRVFGKKDHKTSPQQIYALAAETCKWSAVLKEVIDNADILRLERKLSPMLVLLLVHDLLLSKKGIALPASHGLRVSIERHKARLSAELTRARLRRKAPSLDALHVQVEAAFAETSPKYPRWIRINALRTSLEEQLKTTFKDFVRVDAIGDVAAASSNTLYVDEHIPNLVAVSPSFEVLKSAAYKSGAVILQDKASCFPAYLLDPRAEDGDIIDSCAAPGNKTTHLAAIVSPRAHKVDGTTPRIFAFERNGYRAQTLEKMVAVAGGEDIIDITPKQDFLKVDPNGRAHKNVGCLLLDPSCSGSGIVDREGLPEIHLPGGRSSAAQKSTGEDQNRKRKRNAEGVVGAQEVMVDDDGQQTVISTEQELLSRLDTLSSFQLILLQHAFKFPSAKRVTYSTCSVHAQENEHVVIKALQSEIAKERGWRILPREHQVRGMKDWPVRGSIDAASGDEMVADACIRTYRDDGRGVMGFFVAAFVRDVQGDANNTGSYVRNDELGMTQHVIGMSGLRHVDSGEAKSPTVGGATIVDEDDSSDGWEGFKD
ncbi:S-adenosyl-L-methionine-dependent methyltransferase [Truncatella angustata]|uniref:S-adenosyl-L-methionine-dependent methyltransferase n=1 Tax=Truncatella angustata TaxID=152316 RepID=A0A9P9A5J7_9PEZI|nr:S-adenosyl-L-methionine-dependent methyltransferase [Truncatella angustata]KAH6661400.1 S-adenosyl-L-methionine-dependent methyltransferase [Truncatella angustata]KAH8200260.1 hypothetical protein TruAng_005596 [Truncatella angustata]